jgi:hypothetical protein
MSEDAQVREAMIPGGAFNVTSGTLLETYCRLNSSASKHVGN